jgi:hypothetical protein
MATTRKRARVPEPLVRAVNDAVRMSFVLCHAEGHQWRHHDGIVDPIDSKPGMRPPGNEQTARGTRSTCTSCTSERIRWYTRSGEVVPKYDYADGYLHKKSKLDDEPAPSKLEWRRTLVATLFDDAPPRRRAS